MVDGAGGWFGGEVVVKKRFLGAAGGWWRLSKQYETRWRQSWKKKVVVYGDLELDIGGLAAATTHRG